MASPRDLYDAGAPAWRMPSAVGAADQVLTVQAAGAVAWKDPAALASTIAYAGLPGTNPRTPNIAGAIMADGSAVAWPNVANADIQTVTQTLGAGSPQLTLGYVRWGKLDAGTVAATAALVAQPIKSLRSAALPNPEVATSGLATATLNTTGGVVYYPGVYLEDGADWSFTPYVQIDTTAAGAAALVIYPARFMAVTYTP